MKSKKYYYVRLYQAENWIGYIKEGITISDITEELDKLLEVKSIAFSPVDKIIVEKITPFKVKEILTGCVFPIVNIELRYSYIEPRYYINKQMYEAHTFILSKNDKLIGNDNISSQDLKKYYEKHSNIAAFKEYLTEINHKGEHYKQQAKARKKQK